MILNNKYFICGLIIHFILTPFIFIKILLNISI